MDEGIKELIRKEELEKRVATIGHGSRIPYSVYAHGLIPLLLIMGGFQTPLFGDSSEPPLQEPGNLHECKNCHSHFKPKGHNKGNFCSGNCYKEYYNDK